MISSAALARAGDPILNAWIRKGDAAVPHESTVNRPMRRKARELTLDQAREVIEAAEHAVLATCDAEGFPYAVPVSPVMVGDAIYFHSTGLPGGRKADNMLMNPNVSLCFIAKARPCRNGIRSTLPLRSLRAKPIRLRTRRSGARLLKRFSGAMLRGTARSETTFSSRFADRSPWSGRLRSRKSPGRRAARRNGKKEKASAKCRTWDLLHGLRTCRFKRVFIHGFPAPGRRPRSLRTDDDTPERPQTALQSGLRSFFC